MTSARLAESVESGASCIARTTLKTNGIQLGQTILGTGSYSTVILGFSDRLNCAVAVKKIDRRTRSEYVQRFLPRELNLVMHLNHPNILKVYNIIRTGAHVCMIQEYAANGDMLKIIQKRGRIDEIDGRFWFRQLIAGLEYLESMCIIHRDLKCENLLLDGYNNLKICDFGFARFLQPNQSSTSFYKLNNSFVILAYVALEILRRCTYHNNAVDIWSAGIVLYVMLTGVMPFDDRRPRVMVEQQRKHKLSFHKLSYPSQSARELIYTMLHPNPKVRATIPQILHSEWLRETSYHLRGPAIEDDGSCSDSSCTTANSITDEQYRTLNIKRQ
ncbi:Testis-specific serine/threonine-protein kinase 2 [Aphelenchoides besseyi]|nr:Testis-specific serine/threonine-protein kinase 2 [Aphelenchoides besseyi]KAI6211320.1 Testis-specific serine/threonine-protein kinase 2 [Aphelenchoides besseyi]